MFTYHLSETEYLVFKTYNNYFELFSGHEGGAELKKIANYKGGKWNFDSYDQQKLFWFLFTMFKADFGKAKREAAKKVEMDLLIDPPTEYRKRFPKGGVTKENKIKLNNLPNNK